ncbi:MAG TPA: zinc-dependent alcohol dehydrogenase family protein [Angustibacter sp.]|nr:zinc-dependent alcohol dehydrogenase family protein [Angustibacter sp.]
MSTSHPTVMRAQLLTAVEEPLRLTELPVPAPRHREVLVRIAAAGLNPLDAKIAAGEAAHARVTTPAVLGLDAAGVVVATGPGVDTFRPGDEVYGMIGGVGGVQGSLAEYAAVDVGLLAHKPAQWSMEEAAVLPLSVITAWEGLVDRAGVGPGHTVLIHGGAGGVGHVAVQVALAAGARVWATGTDGQAETLRGLGAVPIDYETTPVEKYVAERTGDEGFDIVYDTVGGTNLDRSFVAVKRYTGHVVSSLGWGSHSLAPLSFRGASYSGVFTLLPLLTGEQRAAHGRILASAASLGAEGLLRPIIAETYPFAQAEQALRQVARGVPGGKVAVRIA